MANKFRDIRKKYKISIKEISEDSKYSISYISRLERGTRAINEKSLSNLVKSLNNILKEKGIKKIILIKDIYINSKEELESLVKTSIIDKSIFTLKKQKEIMLFGEKNEVHSLVFRYILGKTYQKNYKKEEALKIYLELLKNFQCKNFLYSILIEVIRLSKVEDTYDIFIKYKKNIDEAPLETKSIIYYNVGVNLFRSKKYNRAEKLFESVIKLPYITKQYYKSWNNIGVCFKEDKKYYEAIKAFKNSIGDFKNYRDLETCFINVIDCAKEMKDEVLLKVTLKKLESVLFFLEGGVVYQTYYFMGKSYLYLNDEKKAILYFEKEIENKIDFYDKNFRMEIYLDTISELYKLYRLDTIKQQKLIEVVSKIPLKYLDNFFIIDLLKYYFENSMEYEGKLLLKKIKK